MTHPEIRSPICRPCEVNLHTIPTFIECFLIMAYSNYGIFCPFLQGNISTSRDTHRIDTNKMPTSRTSRNISEPSPNDYKPFAHMHQIVGGYIAEYDKPPKGLELGLFDWSYFQRQLKGKVFNKPLSQGITGLEIPDITSRMKDTTSRLPIAAQSTRRNSIEQSQQFTMRDTKERTWGHPDEQTGAMYPIY